MNSAIEKSDMIDKECSDLLMDLNTFKTSPKQAKEYLQNHFCSKYQILDIKRISSVKPLKLMESDEILVERELTCNKDWNEGTKNSLLS